MNKIICLLTALCGVLSVTAQNFSGLQLNSVLPSDFNFTMVDSIILTTNKDSLAKWTFNATDRYFTKSSLNKKESIQYADDSTTFVRTIFNNNKVHRQEIIVENKKKGILKIELIENNTYSLTTFRKGVKYKYKNIPQEKYWEVNTVLPDTTIRFTSKDKGYSYKEEQIVISEFYVWSKAPQFHSVDYWYYNPTKFCVYQEKDCRPLEKLISLKTSDLLNSERLMFLTYNSRVESYTSTSGKIFIDSVIGKPCNTNAQSYLYIKLSNGDTKRETIREVIPIDFNKTKK